MINKTMINDKPVYTISNIDALQKWTKGFAKQFEHYENQMQNFIHQYDFNPQIFASKVRFLKGTKEYNNHIVKWWKIVLRRKLPKW